MQVLHTIIYLYLVFVSSVYSTGFVAETLVHTLDDFVAIEQINVGARIVCSDLQTSCSAQILHTSNHKTSTIVVIQIGNTIICTDHDQPLYVPCEQRWQQASNIVAGQQLLQSNGQYCVVDAVQIIEQPHPVRVYDVSVAYHHTLCVSDKKIVAHNLGFFVPFIAFGAGKVTFFAGITLSKVLYSLAAAVGCYAFERVIEKTTGKQIDITVGLDGTVNNQPLPCIEHGQHPETYKDFGCASSEYIPKQYSCGQTDAIPESIGCSIWKETKSEEYSCGTKPIIVENPEGIVCTIKTNNPQEQQIAQTLKQQGCQYYDRHSEYKKRKRQQHNDKKQSVPQPIKQEPIKKDIHDRVKYPHGIYQDAPYHHKNSKGDKSPAPKNGQRALDNSFPTIKEKVRISFDNGEFVVLNETSERLYHGHVRNWKDLKDYMQSPLIEANIVDKNGKTIKND